MPALNPPSMQIGGLPPGYAPFAVPGPEAFGGQYPFTPFTPASLIQQVSVATTVATPANVTVNFAATGLGNTLAALVAVAGTGSAPTVSTPAGWTVVGFPGGNNPANTIGGRLFLFPNATAGLTSATFNLTNCNGAAVAFYELDDNVVSGTVDLEANVNSQSLANSSNTPGLNPVAPGQAPILLLAYECDVTGQAYTANNLGPGWVADAVATSTTGATLVVIRPFHCVTTPKGGQSYTFQGTLAGAIANGALLLALLLAGGGQVYGAPTGAVAVDQGAGYGATGGGEFGWAYGGGKPGSERQQ